MIRECPELNMVNYNADDVAELNQWAIDADGLIVRLTDALRELHDFADYLRSCSRYGDITIAAFKNAIELLKEQERRDDE